MIHMIAAYVFGLSLGGAVATASPLFMFKTGCEGNTSQKEIPTEYDFAQCFKQVQVLRN